MSNMNFYIQQNISIHLLRIDGISNSSVLQIGSAGIIKPTSNLFNTGQFTGPAPSPAQPGTFVSTADDSSNQFETGTYLEAPSVPLAIPAPA